MTRSGASSQRLVRGRTRNDSLRRATLFRLCSIHTLRYEFLNKAGIVQRPNGRPTLTLSNNEATKAASTRLVAKLRQAA